MAVKQRTGRNGRADLLHAHRGGRCPELVNAMVEISGGAGRGSKWTQLEGDLSRSEAWAAMDPARQEFRACLRPTKVPEA
jgi:hypothetical protein